MTKRTATKSTTLKRKRAKKVTSILNIYKRSKVAKSIVAGGIAIFLLITSVSFLFGVSIYKTFTQDLVSALSTSSYDILDEDIYTVLYVSVSNISEDSPLLDKLSLFLFDVRSQRSFVYNISPGIVVEVPGKFSSEELSKVLALGSLNSTDETLSGMTLLKNTVKKLSKYNIDKYVLVSGSMTQPAYDALAQGDLETLLSSQTLSAIKTSFKTDLSPRDIYQTFKFVSSLPSDRITYREITQEYLDSGYLLSNEIKDLTIDSSVSEERASVSVLNGTTISGLAGFGSDVVETMGGRIIATGNSAIEYKESLIICDDVTSITATSLARFFNVDEIITKDEAYRRLGVNESEVDRSDITVIIGFDIANDLY